MNLDLRQLDAFCRVVEHASFTTAASELGISQAAVSERIARLERAVASPLFDRLGRDVKPSPTGRWLYQRALPVLRAHRRLEHDLAQFLGLEAAELVVGASTIPGEHILPELTAAFQRENPGVRVRVRVLDSLAVVAALKNGEIELGFVGTRIDDKNLRFEALWRDRLVAVVPSDHEWVGRAAVDVSELLGQPFLVREPGSGTRRSLEDALERVGFDSGQLDVVVELGSNQAIKSGILSGLGVAIVSERSVRHEVELGLLHALRVEGLDLQRAFYLVDDPRRGLSPAGERYLAAVRKTDAPLRS